MIEVTSASGRYAIHCRWGALDDLGALMRDAGLSGSAFVVSDDCVGPLCGERALASLRAAGFDAALRTFPAGEASKNLDTVRAIYDWLVDQRAERGSAVVALGGGVTGDLVGFVEMNAVVFGVSPDSVKSHQRFRKKYGLPYNLLVDEEHRLADKLGIWKEENALRRELHGQRAHDGDNRCERTHREDLPESENRRPRRGGCGSGSAALKSRGKSLTRFADFPA